MSETPKKRCPSCKKNKLFRVVTGGIAGFVKGSPTTVGQQAELNLKKMGKEQAQKKAEEIREDKKESRLKLPGGAKKVERPKELPWWRSGEVSGFPRDAKPLDLKKVQDVKRYIREGKK